MEEMLSDRGFVFYSWRGINRFERYLEQEGIEHTHARPHHPQTLGKVEAWNRRIGKELFRQVQFGSVAEAEAARDEFVSLVSHDRFFLNRVVDHLLVVEPERFRTIDGNYDTYVNLFQQDAREKVSER